MNNMQKLLSLSLCFLHLEGALGAKADETMSVMEGYSVTLNTNISEIVNDDTIIWVFGDKEFLISQLTRKRDFTSFFVTDDENFVGRLLVDQKTGSLTIRNLRIRHSGQYKLTISSRQTTSKTFSVNVLGAVKETEGVKSLSVMEGDSVTLQKDATEMHGDDLIVWRFGDKGILLAKIDVENNQTELNVDDERFSDRLKVDHQTGSLTITDARVEDTGLYEVQVIGRESSQQFLVSVSAVSHSVLLAAGIIVGVLLLVGVLLAFIVTYYRRTISELKTAQADPFKVVTVEEKSVEEGNAICLETKTELQNDDEMQWWFNTTLIAEVRGDTTNTYEGDDGRFRNKLKLDKGDLVITKIKTFNSGIYKLEIKGKTSTKYKTFNVTVTVREVVVEKIGGQVILKTGIETLPGDLILWTFGAKHQLIKADSDGFSIINESFRDRLELDHHSGNLTIKNFTNDDYGNFNFQTTNSKQSRFRNFKVVDKTNQQKELNKPTPTQPLLNKREEEQATTSV